MHVWMHDLRQLTKTISSWIHIETECIFHLVDSISKLASFFLSGLRKSREKRDMRKLGELMNANFGKLINHTPKTYRVNIGANISGNYWAKNSRKSRGMIGPQNLNFDFLIFYLKLWMSMNERLAASAIFAATRSADSALVITPTNI